MAGAGRRRARGAAARADGADAPLGRGAGHPRTPATGPSRPRCPSFHPSCARRRWVRSRATCCASWTRSTSGAPCSAATRWAGTWPCGSPWSTATACRGWSSPGRPDSSSGASRAACPTGRTGGGCVGRWRRSSTMPTWSRTAGSRTCTGSSPRRPPRSAILRLARDARRDNLEERLGEIRVPTLLVWGLEDRITPPEVAERFRPLIPDAHLWHLSRCGHAPMLERPERFARGPGRLARRDASRREVAVPRSEASDDRAAPRARCSTGTAPPPAAARAELARSRRRPGAGAAGAWSAPRADTEFGLAHGFRASARWRNTRRGCRCGTTGSIRPWLERAAAGEAT